MRRRTAHLAFASVTLACALFTGYEALRLRQGERVNAAILAAEQGTRSLEGEFADSAIPEARFARAYALAKQGDLDKALVAYKALAREKRADLAVAALYNTGNLHLRAALAGGPNVTARSLPLIELAKQSYRAALRRDPNAWDARYNLERALWLAPELEPPDVDTIKRDAEERVMSTLQGTRGDLP